MAVSGSNFKVRSRPSSNNMTIYRFPVDFKSVASHIHGNRRQSFNLFQVDFMSLASHILVKLIRFVYLFIYLFIYYENRTYLK